METSEYIKNTPESLLGTEIDGYLLESILGYGTYGVVYLARHVIMDRYFAFKILQAEFSEDTGSVNSFFQECKVAAKLEHPHVVQAFKAGRTPEGLCYFVMEYVNGKTLKELIVFNGKLPYVTAINITIQIAKALECAHRNNIIHRDVKPQNILVNENDEIVGIIDLTHSTFSNDLWLDYAWLIWSFEYNTNSRKYTNDLSLNA